MNQNTKLFIHKNAFENIIFEMAGILSRVRWVKYFSVQSPGGRLNKKDGLTRYGNSHVKDKTS